MQGMDALHFRPEWFDKIPSISLVKSDEKIYLENPAALPPTPVAAKPPLRFQSLPNLSSFSNLISIPYIDETVRFC